MIKFKYSNQTNYNAIEEKFCKNLLKLNLTYTNFNAILEEVSEMTKSVEINIRKKIIDQSVDLNLKDELNFGAIDFSDWSVVGK